jgi:hypothetical protein
MLDHTTINIISILVGSVGIVGAITKYDISEAKQAYWGENIFVIKQDIVTSFITWAFTILAVIGLIFQVVFGEILGADFPDRVYESKYYLIFFCIGLFLSVLVALLIKTISVRLSRLVWLPEVLKKCEENYLLAKKLMSSNISDKRIEEIVEWMENLLEIKSKGKTMMQRLSEIEKFYL